MTAEPDDPFDALVLDESFVRSGRHEESADERLDRLKRIARENAAREAPRDWGQHTQRVSRRQGRRLGRVLLSLTLTAGVLVGAMWWSARDAQDGAGAVRTAADVPGPADPGPAVRLARLAPLPPDPGGEGGYRFLNTDENDPTLPITWDPCRPVTYVVNRAGEPPGGDALLQEAVAEIAAATGLVFQRGPDTDEPVVDQRKARQPDRYGDAVAPVLVAWSDERAAPDLAGYIAGYAGPASFGFGPGTWRYTTGVVVLDAEDAVEVLRTSGGAAELRSTVLHELGHLVGLAHVSDREQIMFSEGGDNRLDLGPGDRRGLRLAGNGACHTDWDALLADTAP